MQIEAATKSPKAALEFWKGKAPVSKAEFEALSDAARARAFAVSGLARRSQVETIHTALHQALEKGETLAQFKKRLRPLMERKGWTGKKAWRIENIYRTNMQSAYQAGRFAQMKATAKRRPYWRYVAVKDSRTRPTHSALNGKVFPHDHGFWDTWYPPNGFQCRCTVQTLSKRQVEAKDIQVESRVPRLVEPIDPVSGNRLPARPLAPDPGWAGNVGRDWLSGLAPRELDDGVKLVDLATKAICRQGSRSFAVAEGPYCKPDLAILEKRHILPVSKGYILPANLTDRDYAEAFLKEFGIGFNESVVHNIPTDFDEPIPVVISNLLLMRKKRNGLTLKATKRGRGPYMKLLARTIKSPYEVWWVPTIVSGRRYDTIRLIRLFSGQGADTGGFAVFNLIGNNWTGATVYQPDKNYIAELDKLRIGGLLYREP
ncbi:phage minor head protein [Dethiosulfatarculus sandiegensis]|uniref:Virion morphogenesis protein n=1 Tax=Dethiosulfatarculus sandiegensis TaxID=1429043 RepID=A0A0D2GJN2_9BACT|nr:phage minor head protein [Dethiosulfatarculus sandiegensis]KIX14972.1 virion morphogenesis protein [Dethiosulfatarculus sandiegensis]